MMKRILQRKKASVSSIFIVIFCLCLISTCGALFAQQANLNVVFTTTDAGGSYDNEHVHVVWLETNAGQFVSTIGTNVGIERALWANNRAYSLNVWDNKNPSRGADVDARTGATQSSYRTYNINWNWRKRDGSVVPNGSYRLRFQCTNADSGNPSNLTTLNISKDITPWTVGPVSQGGYNNVRLAFTPAGLGVVNDEATDVTESSARLNGYVTGTEGDDPAVYIYWGDEDGGTNIANWDHEIAAGTMGEGAFSADITGLSGGTTYYFRCYVENSIKSSWAASTSSFKAITSRTIFEKGDTWKYFKGYSTPSGWNTLNFNDAGWLSGPTGIGYGDDDDATVLSDMEDHYWSVYIRYDFNVDFPPGVEAMTFTVDYDDGFVAFINGHIVARRGVPEGQIYNTPSSSHESGTPVVIDLTEHKSRLLTGDNVFAIEVHNATFSSSDLTMIPELVIVGGMRDPQGDIFLSPDALDFSSVAVGDFSELTFDIANTGNLDLEITSLTITGLDKAEYSIVSPPLTPFTLAASTGMQTVTARFSPNGALDYRNADITVGSDDPDEPVATIALTGSDTPGASVALNAIAGLDNNCNAIALYNQYVVIGQGNVLAVIEKTGDGANTQFIPIGQVTLADEVTDIAIEDDLAFVSAGTQGLRIYSLADPAAPSLTGEYSTDGFASSVAASNGKAIVGDGNSAYILDVSNVNLPSLTGRWDSDGRVLGVAIDPSYAYVANGDRGIEVLSLSDASWVTGFDTQGVCYGLAGTSNLLCVADGTKGLQILDVSMLPSVPSLIAGFDTPGIATDVTLIGNRVCVADNVGGVTVVDISNPSQPALYGRSNQSPHSLSTVVTDSRVLVADPKGGLTVLAAQQWPGIPFGDINGDSFVNLAEITTIADNWLGTETKLDVLLGNLNDDTTINLSDFVIIAQNWLVREIDSTGLMTQLKFDEETGDLTIDSSGNDRHGELVHMNNEDHLPGIKGNALDFDGHDDYVEIVGYHGVTGSNPRTCSAWIKTTTGGQIMTWGQTGTPGYRWIIQIQASGIVFVAVGGGSIVGSTAINDGSWHHIAVVSDGTTTDNIKIFIDGQIDEQSALASRAINTASSTNVKIGVHLETKAYFQGQIDEVRIYERLLTEEEIGYLAN